jgi:nitrite reductase/ring-hydroxylating ferredoxin subunit/uncharacterized membrane protein
MERHAGSFGRNVIFDAIVRSTQDQDVVERIAKSVQPAVGSVLKDERGKKSVVANLLHGTWLGHPLHPVLTDFPIGAWTMAALLDAAAAIAKRDDLLPAADFCVGVGVTTAVVTAAAGIADWSQTYGRPARVGVVHACFNIAATALYGAALLTRQRNRPFGTALSYGGFAMAMVGAGLGGHLVFGEQIGVNHSAAEDLPTDFVPVMDERDLRENQPAKATFQEHDIVLVRRGTNIYALLNSCAHLGGPLCEGSLENGSIRCPWHGSLFRLEDGELLEGPATNNQPVFETRVRNGKIEVRSPEPSAP